MVLRNAAEKLVEDVSSASETFAAEVAVVGGGPAGLVSAIALAAAGVDTLLVAPPRRPGSPHHRAACRVRSRRWKRSAYGRRCAAACRAAPQNSVSSTTPGGSSARRRCHFAAAEIGLDAFGYNIENRHLFAALEARAAELNLPRIAAPALAVTTDAGGVTIEHAGGEAARCGSRSEPTGSVRCAAPRPAFRTTRHTYPQTALTLNLAHARPHDDTSTEFHTESGPFTLVPLPGQRSSLVCVLDPAGAAELSAMNDDGPVGRDRAPRPFAARHR